MTASRLEDVGVGVGPIGTSTLPTSMPDALTPSGGRGGGNIVPVPPNPPPVPPPVEPTEPECGGEGDWLWLLPAPLIPVKEPIRCAAAEKEGAV